MTSSGARRPQHEGTTWAGSWWRQAARWFDAAAVELGSQRHMGRNSGWHFGQCLPPTECHHRGQCSWDCSCQKDQQIQLTQLDTRLLSSGLGNTWPLECQRSGVRGSNRQAFDRGDDWPSRNHFSVPTLVCRRPAFQCGLPSRHVPNFRVRTVTIPQTRSILFLIFQPSGTEYLERKRN